MPESPCNHGAHQRISVGMDTLPFNGDYHGLVHISQSTCTHMHACIQKFQTSHYSMSTVIHLHYCLGVGVWSKSDIDSGLAASSPFIRKGSPWPVGSTP